MQADIPTGYLDASTIRPVPDTQEVYTSPHDSSGQSVPISIIIDICEEVPRSVPDWKPAEVEANLQVINPDDEKALETHFYDVLDSGDKEEIYERDNEVLFTNIDGRKGHEVVARVERRGGGGIQLGLLLLRLREKKTDLVVSVIVGSREGHVLGDVVRKRLRESLRLVDWGLFVVDEDVDEEMKDDVGS